MSKKFAVFDIDGTLFRWQLYHELFDELVRREVIPQEVAAPVFEARDTWYCRKSHFLNYEDVLVEVMEQAMTGLPESTLLDAADTIIATNGHRTYRYTTELLRDLKEKGYTIVSISGSHQQLVERFAALHGIDIIYGRQHEIKDGIVTENVKVVYGRKAEILRELVETNDLDLGDSYAIGDTDSDGDMLELVTNPIAFNPDEALYEKALKNGWPIRVERKNIIYKLDPHGNTFVLA